MKKFCISLIIFVSILGLIIFIIGRDYGHSKSDYLDAIIDKHSRLNKIDSPRLIFCGGSNMAFGINSEMIEKEIGIPVVNLGLHAELGLEFMINELELSVKSNDQVIICPEYFLRVKGNYYYQHHIIKKFPEAVNYFYATIFQKTKTFFSEELKENIYNNFSYWAGSKNVEDTTDIYKRKGFNHYGDMVLHLGKIPPHGMYDKEIMKSKRWGGIDALNELADFANKKNIKVCFMFPTYPISEFTKNEKVLSKYAQDLKHELKLPILSDPQYFAFDDSLFWDTVYHLNKEGREKRTQLIIALLKKNNIISIK